ncbi:DUF2521 family protein [Sporolactobacillus sp. Y61]|uniref:DUF2521 family protein n=1 Tax=Sporolactobacillus sp. Y61 TaxID=3160863 RepID=A0AAU8IHE7_9BACL|nr:DUF2521 family protein [Sporolactobacillus sp. THM19-2]RYL89413.1 DUF2521 family protein [Sporolactobacillus sp. THM19-2]
MAVVMDFQKKKRDKQIHSERRALQDLSFEKIQSAIHHTFDRYLSALPTGSSMAMEMCAEYALESFLLGSSMGRFGFYGEREEVVFERSQPKFDMLHEDFFDFWRFWSTDPEELRGIDQACRTFLHGWWLDGFDLSVKRLRMKLH